jgi:hypothetical protein
MAKRPRKTKIANTQSTTEEVVIGDYKFDQPAPAPVAVEEEPVEYIEVQHPLLQENADGTVTYVKEPAVVKYVKVDPNKLVIKVDENGNPASHPIFHGNMKDIFGTFDPNNLPPGFEHFKRIPFPVLEPTQVYEGTDYVKVDGVWQDFHKVRELTPQELLDRKITLPQGV